MKILYIVCGNGNSAAIGGSFMRTIEIAKRIDNENKVFFLTSSGGKEVLLQNKFNEADIFEAKSYLFRRKTEKTCLTMFYVYVIGIVRAFALIKSLPRVDIVYTDSDGFWDIIPAFLYKRKYPTIKWISLHCHKVSLRKDNIQSFLISLANMFIQKFSYFFVCKYSDSIFVLDTDMGDKIKIFFKKRKYKKKMYSVKIGTNIKQITTVPEQEKKYDVCFLGGLRPSKGLYDFVPIWSDVCQKRENAKLIIIGEMFPKYNKYLSEEIAKYKLESNVVVRGFIREKIEVIKLLKQSKIFIFPSHEEGWGISVMECLSAGLPGILWDLPVYNRIFNKGVIKVKPFDISLFVKQILYLLDNQKAYNNFQRETLQEVSRYDWNNIKKEELAIFNELASKAAARN